MKTYTKPILMAVAMLSMIGCDKSDADGRFNDNPRSEIGTPQEGSLVTAKQVKWNFDNADDWVNASQDENANISQTSLESNTQAEDGKVVKIYTEANTQQRKKLKTKKQYGAGLYTWRTYISDLGATERVSIGSWLWNSDKHELDFEVGSGTAKERETLGVTDDEVIAYITCQDNPFVQQKVKIKKNTWHTFKIDLQLVDNKYFATWIIDDVKCAAQQLTYGQEHPFYIFCSTENLKFIGDNWPYQENYGLWDYVTYTPYSYSIAPVEPSTQTNPIDETPEPDKGEAKRWDFNTFPNDWGKWTNVGADGSAFSKLDNGKLILTTNSYCNVSKAYYKPQVGYGKYTCSIRLPEVNESAKIQMGMILYFYTDTPKTIERLFQMVARYGKDEDRTRLGAKQGEMLLFIASAEPGLSSYKQVLQPNKDYKFTIELKKAGNKYVAVYYLDDKPIQTLKTNFGEDDFKFELGISAESNRGDWLPGNQLKDPTKKYNATFNFIEYTAY